MTNLEKTHEYLKNKKKASPTSSTNKEKENHWGTCKCNRKVHWYLDMSR